MIGLFFIVNIFEEDKRKIYFDTFYWRDYCRHIFVFQRSHFVQFYSRMGSCSGPSGQRKDDWNTAWLDVCKYTLRTRSLDIKTSPKLTSSFSQSMDLTIAPCYSIRMSFWALWQLMLILRYKEHHCIRWLRMTVYILTSMQTNVRGEKKFFSWYHLFETSAETESFSWSRATQSVFLW